MHEFSTADGFVEINESLSEMIKYIANEPSVGLYYIQQHVQKAAPNVVNRNNNVLEKSRETVLHTEDLEDSITMVKSMRECGTLIADDMIGDIKSCLSIMSTRQPRRGLILNTSPWIRSNISLHSSYNDEESETSNYFSSVFKSAKQKASSIKWPQLDLEEQNLDPEKGDDVEGHMSSLLDVKMCKGEHFLETEHYDEFKAGKEANLKAWLGDVDGNTGVGGQPAERI